MNKNTRSPIRIPDARSENQPATRKMLSLVRHELIKRFDGLETGLRADIQNVETGLRSEMTELRSGLKKTDANLRKSIQSLEAGNIRMQVLLEEQGANNRIVLEGLQALWQRQEQLEG